MLNLYKRNFFGQVPLRVLVPQVIILVEHIIEIFILIVLWQLYSQFMEVLTVGEEIQGLHQVWRR